MARAFFNLTMSKTESETSQEWALHKQIVKAEKIEFLKKNTDECERVCGELGLDIKPLNNGYHLKITDGKTTVDFWPTHRKFGTQGRYFNAPIETTIKKLFKV